MNNSEALRLLRGSREGALEWNRLGRQGDAAPGLDGVDLSCLDMRGVGLSGVRLCGANRSDASLRDAVSNSFSLSI